MKILTIILGLAVVFSGLAGCKQEEKTPCQRLVEQETRCGYEMGVTAGDCEKNIKSLQMRTSIDCLKAKDCETFLPCRKQANELTGIKTGLEDL